MATTVAIPCLGNGIPQKLSVLKKNGIQIKNVGITVIKTMAKNVASFAFTNRMIYLNFEKKQAYIHYFMVTGTTSIVSFTLFPKPK